MTARRRPADRRAPAAWGTVELLPSGRHRAFYRRDGVKFAAPRTFETRADAQDWLAAERTDRSRGTWVDPRQGRVTLAQFAADWIESRPDLTPRTRDLYERSLRRWVLPRIGEARGVELGALTLAECTPSVVRVWYAAVYRAAAANATRLRACEAERRAHPARVWAREQGHEVAPTGRISPALLTAWRAAGAPTPLPKVDPTRLADDPGRRTAAQAYSLLRTIMNTAQREGLVTVNPCQIRGAGSAPARERTTATPAEVAALAAHMPRRLAAAVTLAAWSGLRYGELFALARRHVDLDAGTVRVDRALVVLTGQPITFGKPKTRQSRRTVHLPGFVLDALRVHLTEFTSGDPDALVFATKAGEPVPNLALSAQFKRARIAVGRTDLTWHDLRHTGATLAYSTGASVREVQNRLGHSTMRAASIYAHAADDSDRVLADRLDALYATGATAPALRPVAS